MNCKIARAGCFEWRAKNESAGPYYIGWQSFMFHYRAFGVRSLSIQKEGSYAHREAFRQSKAAFECLRTYLDLCCGFDPEESLASQAIDLAAKAARAEYPRWLGQFDRYHGAENGYIVATIERFDKLIEESILTQPNNMID